MKHELKKSQEKLFQVLKKLEIQFRILDHAPIFRADDSENILHVKKTLAGAHTKNLFLKSPKQFYLVIIADEDRACLSSLRKILREKKLSFANEDYLKKYLGVLPGSVTPFGLINDASKIVNLVMDEKLFSKKFLNFHPLMNDQTLQIDQEDFKKFVNFLGYKIKLLNVPKKIS